MCDPIVDSSIQKRTEAFDPRVVESLGKDLGTQRFPERHYNQLRTTFDPHKVAGALAKLGIPTDSTATVFGGYTGQFADCLRRTGMTVIFTDPIKDWVDAASRKGLEAYTYAAEEIPRAIFERSDLFATFECYQPFAESRTSVYTALRMLASKYGILFAESLATRQEVKRDGVCGGLKLSFLPFYKNYSISRRFVELEGLRLYRFNSDPDQKGVILSDCKVMKFLYEHFRDGSTLDDEAMVSIATGTGIRLADVEASVNRVMKTHQDSVPRSLRPYSADGQFRIFSKLFKLNRATN